MTEVSDAKTKGYKLKFRDETIDIIKGVGIILMVMGHSASPLHNFIYLFHMAIFFIASGYFWNDKNVKDLSSAGICLWKRIKALYIPYVVANGILHMLHNAFIYLGIYNGDYLTVSEIGLGLVKIVLTKDITILGRASWFLLALLRVSIIHLVISYIKVHFKFGKFMYYAVVIATFAMTALIGIFGNSFIDGALNFPAYAAYLIGIYIKKKDLMSKICRHKAIAFLLSLSLLTVLNMFGTVDMMNAKITSLIYFVAVSMAGWTMLYTFAQALKRLDLKCITGMLGYCGRHSLWIVLLHFLALRTVTYIYIVLTKSDIGLLSQIHALNNEPFLWIAYTIIGVSLPLLVEFIFLKLLEMIPKGAKQ